MFSQKIQLNGVLKMSKSVMNHSFSQVPKAEIPRSVFDRSHGHKTTFDADYLVPIFRDEVLPGDTVNLRATLFCRLATPLKPFMDNLFMDVFHFFVPLRLLWENFQRFMGEQDNPADTTDFHIPQYDGLVYDDVHSLSDYFGLAIGKDVEVSAMYHRAYSKIYHDWFRDQNLIDAPVLNTGDGPDSISDYTLRKRCKKHDYFTSCLPWPQKGPDVYLPLQGNADVWGNHKSLVWTDGTYLNNTGYDTTSDALSSDRDTQNENVGGVLTSFTSPASKKLMGLMEKSQVTSGFTTSGLYADLESVAAATINSIREAFQLQKLFERDARAGTRYIEIIRSHFGVISPDARLQRSEFLGSTSTRINVNPVQQTSETSYTGSPSTVKSAQGNLAAYAVGHESGSGYTKSFVEHGIIMSFVNVRADITYQQGIPRQFSRETRYDFYWPALAHLGEQPVLNKEIYAQDQSVVDLNGDPVNDNVFGYQERWAELRYFPSQITGKFRSTYATPLDNWHLSQEFGSLPVLGEEFILSDTPISRVVAVPTEPQFLLDTYFDYKNARALPTYGVPGLVDHF